MAAYAALTSLMQILDQLERHPFPPISLDREQVQSLTEIATFLQEFLEGYDSPFVDSNEADPLEMRIADAAYAAEDVIESYIVDNIHFAAAAAHDDEVISSGGELNSEKEINSDDKDVRAHQQQQRNIFRSSSLYAVLLQLLDKLTGEPSSLQVIPITGMGGTGKTTLARNIFENALIKEHFRICAWVTISQQYNTKEILSQILYQVSGESSGESEEELGDALYKYLYGRRYLIIMDDMWSIDVWEKMKFFFADCNDGSRIIVTTRQSDLTSQLTDSNGGLDMATHDDASSSREYTFSGEELNSEEEISYVNFYQDVWKVIEEMDLVRKEVMEMKREKTAVQCHHQLLRNILRSSSFTGKNSGVMVGFDDVLLQLLHKLTGEPSSDLQVIPITGMGGIGKTTLARNTFQHAYVKKHFDICAWVTISQQYNTKEIVSQIFYQASGEPSKKSTVKDIGNELRRYLFDRRYLIIMNDIWTIKVWEEMSFYFPHCNKGSRIVFTTRQSFLTSQLTKDSDDVFHMKFLDGDNSWNLFTKTVFGEEGFTSELEIVGKKIVEKCRGLPLSIVLIGGLLAKSQHTQKYWEHIEQNFNSIVNLENDEFCLKILKLSYRHLPAYLKPCFLYMGIFEEDKIIRVSTLIRLWVCEGFIKPKKGKSLETIGKEFLMDLIDRNLILVDGFGSTGNIKNCKIHDLLRDLCLKEGEKERFYHVIQHDSSQGIHKHKRRRMVCPERRVLDVLESTTTSHVRSFTSHSQYDCVGVLPNFRLLRIWNTHPKIGFNHYSLEDVMDELVNSRYVAITIATWKSKLPSSVDLFWNLHTLDVNRGGLIIAPVTIWKMSQLRHVNGGRHFGGLIYLPDPPSESSVILENLETLQKVVNFKCGEEVVKRIPNIKKLTIIYKQLRDIGRHDDDDYCLSNLKCLRKLESFAMIFRLGNGCHDLLHNITFPHSLKKLTLALLNSVVGWEEMLEKIGSLPLLQKLRLVLGEFTTHKWETVEGQFPSLKFLKLYWCFGLKYWTMESSHFPCLEHLHLRNLQELEEIPLEIGDIPTLQSINLTLCSESAVKSAKKIVEEQEELQGDNTFCVQVVESREKQEALQSLESPNFKFEWID